MITSRGVWLGSYRGEADCDVPYRFGYRPTARWPYAFTDRQFCRLLILRGPIQDGEFADDLGRSPSAAAPAV